MFLVAGTCIGGGMLALPISSSQVGFWPAVVIMLFSCLFMTITGLLFLEATLWLKGTPHIIGLSSTLLNKAGVIVCWLVYLFIGYASLVAYVSGGGKEFSFVFSEIFNFPFSHNLGCLFFVLVFGLIIFFGYKTVERVNTLIFIGMIFAYICMTSLGHSEIKIKLLQKQNWQLSNLIFIVPLMLTTFSFPGIVPTIVPYLNRDVKSLRIAIVGGTSLTFLVYFIWLMIVFGTVPVEGQHGLQEAFTCDMPATECLHFSIKNPLLSYFAQFFAFFALATSFLGIGLALFDFLSDGLKIPKKGIGKITLCSLIAIPIFLFAINFERAFITALEMSGGIGDALISGLLPVLMIWNGRYKLKIQNPQDYTVKGGKSLLMVIGLFSIFVLGSEIFRRII